KTFGGDVGSATRVSDAAADTVAKHAPFSNAAAEVDKSASAAAKGDTAGVVQHSLNAVRDFGQTVVSMTVGLEGGAGPKGPGGPEPQPGGGPKPAEASPQSPRADSVPPPANFEGAPTQRAPEAPKQGPTYAQVRNGPPVVDGQRPAPSSGPPTEKGIGGPQPKNDAVIRGD